MRAEQSLLTDTLGFYLSALDEMAPGVVEGVYVVGSAALGDWHAAASDIDVVAITAEPATEDDSVAIRAAHALLSEVRPVPNIDGPYVAWGDLPVEPATGLHRPWVLDGAFHHDGECFEINPVTWYTLAKYGLAVRGPAPDRLEIAVDVEARIRFVVDNLDSYWRALGEQIEAAIGRRTFTTADLEWCVLGPLRLHYTAFTADVTSKRGAGEYGLTGVPAHFHDTIRRALAVRAAAIDALADDGDMAVTAELIAWVVDDVISASRA